MGLCSGSFEHWLTILCKNKPNTSTEYVIKERGNQSKEVQKLQIKHTKKSFHSTDWKCHFFYKNIHLKYEEHSKQIKRGVSWPACVVVWSSTQNMSADALSCGWSHLLLCVSFRQRALNVAPILGAARYIEQRGWKHGVSDGFQNSLGCRGLSTLGEQNGCFMVSLLMFLHFINGHHSL